MADSTGQREERFDPTDPYGAAVLFLSQSLAHKFHCQEQVDQLLDALLQLDPPQLPDARLDDVLVPIDALLDRIEADDPLIELVGALLRLGSHTQPTTARSQRLYRAVLWTALRHDPDRNTARVISMLQGATPGARFQASDWPRHEFFAIVLVLIYLGGPEARRELVELQAAARDLGYHDLAPILAWYLDHRHRVPAR
ncbi:MAG: hypothetical protein OEV40_07370 [Acidimicrobiia bacterium]|nr:hypothetical protein [Acidimicrobiia bacterium]